MFDTISLEAPITNLTITNIVELVNQLHPSPPPHHHHSRSNSPVFARPMWLKRCHLEQEPVPPLSCPHPHHPHHHPHHPYHHPQLDVVLNLETLFEMIFANYIIQTLRTFYTAPTVQINVLSMSVCPEMNYTM